MTELRCHLGTRRPSVREHQGTGPASLLGWKAVPGAQGQRADSKTRERPWGRTVSESQARLASQERWQQGGIWEQGIGGCSKGASHLLSKTPGQTEREKDFAASYQGLLSAFEDDDRKEKARLKGSFLLGEVQPA